MADSSASQLVEDMRTKCKESGAQFFPWASVDSRELAEEEMNSDDIGPFLRAVCGKAADQGAPLPNACPSLSSPPPLPLMGTFALTRQRLRRSIRNVVSS